MRTWLYDRLITDPDLQDLMGGVEGIQTRVMPRRSRGTIEVQPPFIVYGLGNHTNESLGDSTADDVDASRQFFQIWIHDEESGTYLNIDEIIPIVKARLTGASSPGNNIMTIAWLENSQEFHNETYNTNFRYMRFQAILGKTGV